MKNFIAILFCVAMAALLSSCCPKCPCDTGNTKDTTKTYWVNLSSEDSLLLVRVKELVESPKKVATITMDSASKMIACFQNNTTLKNKDNAYISAADAVTMLVNWSRSATGLFWQRGLDEAGRLHWLCWEEDTVEVPVYVMSEKSCMCKPCCAGTPCQ